MLHEFTFHISQGSFQNKTMTEHLKPHLYQLRKKRNLWSCWHNSCWQKQYFSQRSSHCGVRGGSCTSTKAPVSQDVPKSLGGLCWHRGALHGFSASWPHNSYSLPSPCNSPAASGNLKGYCRRSGRCSSQLAGPAQSAGPVWRAGRDSWKWQRPTLASR